MTGFEKRRRDVSIRSSRWGRFRNRWGSWTVVSLDAFWRISHVVIAAVPLKHARSDVMAQNLAITGQALDPVVFVVAPFEATESGKG